VATSLNNLAALLEATGRAAEALPLLERAAQVEEKVVSALLPSGSSRQKRALLAQFSGTANARVSAHVDLLPRSARAARLALCTVLRSKGRELDASVDMLAALRARARGADADMLAALVSLHAELATRALGGPRRGETVAAHEAAMAELRARAEAVEGELGRSHASLKVGSRSITLAAVQAAVPAGAALVEIAAYRPFDARARRGKKLAAPRYIAFVLGREGEPSWVALGAAAPIDELALRVRQLAAEGSADYAPAARELDAKVMAPIRPRLGGVRDLYLSPDGALNLVPFGALIDEDDAFLLTRYRFTYLTSGRDLLRLGLAGASVGSGDAIVAAPEFGPVGQVGAHARAQDATDATTDRAARGRRSADFGSIAFPPLAGAAAEGRAVAKLLGGARLFEGAAATEAALEGLRGPRILHVATHGFFLPDEPAPELSGGGGRAFQVVGEEPSGGPLLAGGWRGEDPLLRAGLALAGANARRSGDGDGILTALELAGLDLGGTKVAVLSACETGVGATNNGESVYGLRRALVLAGAQAQLTSLWKVDDRATVALMGEYYERLAAGAGRSDALREAALGMLGRPETRHPYYWAAFIAAGDGRSLGGAEPPPVRFVDGPAASDAVRSLRVPPGRGCACRLGGRQQEEPGGSCGWLVLLVCALGRGARRRRAAAEANRRQR
jgi:CHAT domain-containing protein